MTIKSKFKFVDKIQDAKLYKKELSKEVNDLKILLNFTNFTNFIDLRV